MCAVLVAQAKFGEFVAWRGPPVFVIECIRGWANDILKVMNRTSRESREDRDFSDAVGLQVNKTGHFYSIQCADLCIIYTRRPNYCRSQISHDRPSSRGS